MHCLLRIFRMRHTNDRRLWCAVTGLSEARVSQKRTCKRVFFISLVNCARVTMTKELRRSLTAPCSAGSSAKPRCGFQAFIKYHDIDVLPINRHLIELRKSVTIRHSSSEACSFPKLTLYVAICNAFKHLFLFTVFRTYRSL